MPPKKWVPPCDAEARQRALGPGAEEWLERLWECFAPLPAPGPSDWLAKGNAAGFRDRGGQTFKQFSTPGPHRNFPAKTHSEIVLVPLGDCSAAPPTQALQSVLGAFYQLPAVTGKVKLKAKDVDALPRDAEGSGYGPQLETKPVHELLLKHRQRSAFAMVAFTMFDLNNPAAGLNFVFGEADAEACTGVFSFARYRDPGSEGLFVRRCIMVLCHEVGHLFGMRHCVYAQCIMNGSNTLEEADRRPMAFCPVCLRKFQDSIKGVCPLDPVKREKELLEGLSALGLEQDAQHCRARLRALGAEVEGPAAQPEAAPDADEDDEGLPRAATSHGCSGCMMDDEPPYAVPEGDAGAAAHGDPQDTLKGSLQRAKLRAATEDGDAAALERLGRLTEECAAKGRPWEDPDFPAEAGSIGIEGFVPEASGDEEEGDAWDWVRVGGGLCPPGCDVVPADCCPCDVQQGRFPDCFFITSAACIAESRPLLQRLFLSPTLLESGVAAARIWNQGHWQVVFIDDRVPCAGNSRPLFARAPRGHAWPMLLEKAYAKYYGSYSAIAGGNLAESMHDLTGAPVESWNLRQLDGDGQAQLWREVTALRKRGCPVAAGTPKTPEGATHTKNKDGLVAGHAYGVLGIHTVQYKGKPLTLFRMYNPWGRHSVWNGEWSRRSPLWTPELRQELGAEHPDGIFFISAKDVCGRFETLYCAHTYVKGLPDGVRYEGAFEGASAGGSTQFHTFRRNQTFAVTARAEVTVHCELAQPDQRKGRLPDSPPIDYPQIGVTVTVATGEAAACPEPTPAALISYDVAHKMPFWNRREVYCRCKLAPRDRPYYFTPSTFYAGQEARWTFTLTPDSADATVAPAAWGHCTEAAGHWDYVPEGMASHPQFLVNAPGGAWVTLVLSQPEKRRSTPPKPRTPPKPAAKRGAPARGRSPAPVSDAAATTTTGVHPIALILWKRSKGAADGAAEELRVGGTPSFSNRTEIARCFCAAEGDAPFTVCCAVMGKQGVKDAFTLSAYCAAGKVELTPVTPPAPAPAAAGRQNTPPRGKPGGKGGRGGGAGGRGGGAVSMQQAQRSMAGLGDMYAGL